MKKKSTRSWPRLGRVAVHHPDRLEVVRRDLDAGLLAGLPHGRGANRLVAVEVPRDRRVSAVLEAGLEAAGQQHPAVARPGRRRPPARACAVQGASRSSRSYVRRHGTCAGATAGGCPCTDAPRTPAGAARAPDRAGRAGRRGGRAGRAGRVPVRARLRGDRASRSAPTRSAPAPRTSTTTPPTATRCRRPSGGLLVWRKADNLTAFTDGYWTWVNGPRGLQRRLNSERFDWEGGGAPAAPRRRRARARPRPRPGLRPRRPPRSRVERQAAAPGRGGRRQRHGHEPLRRADRRRWSTWSRARRRTTRPAGRSPTRRARS